MSQVVEQCGLQMPSREIDLLLMGVVNMVGGSPNSPSLEEFLTAARGAISAERERTIKVIFSSLDTSKDGFVNMREIQVYFNPGYYPDVLNKKLRKDQALQDFVTKFERAGVDDGIGQNAFLEYYKDISCAYADEEEFIHMMRNQWTSPMGSAGISPAGGARRRN